MITKTFILESAFQIISSSLVPLKFDVRSAIGNTQSHMTNNQQKNIKTLKYNLDSVTDYECVLNTAFIKCTALI